MADLGQWDTKLLAMTDAQMAERLLARLDRRNPELRRLLMLAAIPRVVDPQLLAATAGVPCDEDFMETYRAVASLPFVEVGDGDTLTVHDDIRGPCLALWREHGLDGESVEHVRALVLDIWQQRYHDACREEAALDLVGPIVRDANQDRFLSAIRAVKRNVEHALLEGVNAAVAVGPATGKQCLEAWLNDRDERHEYASSDLLARAFADAVSVLADSGERETYSAWAAYYRALTLANLEDWEEAYGALEIAGRVAPEDPVLSLWVEGARETILYRQGRFAEAQEAVESLIAMNQAQHVDSWNEHVAHGQRAQVLLMRWRVDEAVAGYLEAIESATAAGNVEGAIEARLALSGCTEEEDLAAAHVLRALVHARLRCASRVVNARCTRRALIVFGADSPRLAALLAQEVRQLRRGEGPHGEVDVFSDLAETWSRAGLPRRAAAALDEAIDFASALVPERIPELSANRAALGDDLGQARDAAEANLAVVRDPIAGEDPWQRARCLMNAATSLLQLTEAEQALDLAGQAEPLFAWMGNDRAATFTWVVRAEAHRLLGRLGDAEACLRHSTGTPLPGNYQAFGHLVAGRLRAGRGDLAGAADEMRRACIVTRRFHDPSSILAVGGEAMRHLAKSSNFVDCAELSQELLDAARKLRARDAWEPTDATAGADGHAAEAVRIWKAGLGDDRARLLAAREHCSEALRHDPNEGWIHLEAALVSLALDDKSAAQRSLDAAISRASSDLVGSALKEALEEVLG
jgi:tetratricopeptide (TPR) repeat protein